jgi:hypothetical protein
MMHVSVKERCPYRTAVPLTVSQLGRKLLELIRELAGNKWNERRIFLAVGVTIYSALPTAAQSIFDTEPAYGQRLFPLEQPQRPRPPVEDVQDDPKWKTSRPGVYSLEKTKIEVRTESNIFSVFERGKRIYSNASLAQAKRFAEKRADVVAESEKARREQQQPEAKAAH